MQVTGRYLEAWVTPRPRICWLGAEPVQVALGDASSWHSCLDPCPNPPASNSPDGDTAQSIPKTATHSALGISPLATRDRLLQVFQACSSMNIFLC